MYLALAYVEPHRWRLPILASRVPASVIGIDGRALQLACHWLGLRRLVPLLEQASSASPGFWEKTVVGCPICVHTTHIIYVGTEGGGHSYHVCGSRVTMPCRLHGTCGENAFALQALSTVWVAAETKLGGLGRWGISLPAPAPASFVAHFRFSGQP